jgi:hypothetical protein
MQLVACRGCEPASESPAAPVAPGASVAPPAASGNAAAVLVGSVRLAAGASLPAYSPEQMERKVLQHVERGALPEVCTPPKIADRLPVLTTADGKLIGVMVTTSNFSKTPQRAPLVHEVVIKDCRLTPRFVVAMQGDTLRLRNEVDYPFMPAFGKTPVLKTLVPGQLEDIPLKEPTVDSVLCGFTAPCGRTDVVVLFHPLYAVTDEQGNFRIDDFPVDETVTVNAWHPLFGTQELSVRAERGEEKRVELVIAPAAPAAPAAPPPPTAAPAPR